MKITPPQKEQVELQELPKAAFIDAKFLTAKNLKETIQGAALCVRIAVNSLNVADLNSIKELVTDYLNYINAIVTELEQNTDLTPTLAMIADLLQAAHLIPAAKMQSGLSQNSYMPVFDVETIVYASNLIHRLRKMHKNIFEKLVQVG